MKLISWALLALGGLSLAGCAGSPPPPVADLGPMVSPAPDWKASLPPSDPTSGVWLGVFQEKTPSDEPGLRALEAELGKKFAVQMWFSDFSSGFPSSDAEKSWNAGTLPDITWEPWLWTDKERIHLADIVSGRWDDYIRAWGKGAAAWGKPVMVRWGHEFNGDWYPWSLAKNGGDAGLYIRAYQRVHDLVTAEGARNILWVWCPNQSSTPVQSDPMMAYPGDKYVDWVALDGYDFNGDVSFTSLFTKIYRQVLDRTSRPMFIGETSTGRKGNEKSTWIADMGRDLPIRFPAVKGLVWFDLNKERDWRIEESPEALAGAAVVLKDPLFRSDRDSVFALGAGYETQWEKAKAQALADNAVDRRTLKVSPVSNPPGPGEPVKGPQGPVGTVTVAWDPQGLQIHWVSTAGRPPTNSKPADGVWNGDNLELCIAADPKAVPTRAAFGPGDRQIGLTPADAGTGTPARTWDWSVTHGPLAGATVVSQVTATGWILDAVLPWGALGVTQPGPGLTLGFDFAIDMAGPDGNRKTQWIWNGSGQFYNDPSQWGQIQLKP